MAELTKKIEIGRKGERQDVGYASEFRRYSDGIK